jgi:hypothetical protein
VAIGLALYVLVLGRLADHPIGSKYHNTFLFLKDMNAALLAIPAAVLAYWFSRRNNYVQALRQFWDKVIPSAQETIQYTYLHSPDERDFAKVMASLSVVIDSLRGVFANVPAKDLEIGLYPYENLKTIRRIIKTLDPAKGKVEESDRKAARDCIVRMWHQMHQALLLEFDRAVPTFALDIRSDKYCRLRDKLASNTKFMKFVPAILHYDPLQAGPPASSPGTRDTALSMVELDSSPPSPDAFRYPPPPSTTGPGRARRRQRWSIFGQRLFARNR